MVLLGGCPESVTPSGDIVVPHPDLLQGADLESPRQDLPRPSCTLGPSDCFTRKYYVLIYNPILESQGGKRLTAYKGWDKVDTLIKQYVAGITVASHGVVSYVEAARLEADDYAIKEDGFQYDDTSFLACLADVKKCHKPGLADGFGYAVNYAAILSKYKICEKFNNKEFEELWMFGSPFMGFWEANQAGTGAFHTNGPVVTGTACSGVLNIMGFSYERGVAEMLEDFGHRAEGTMAHVYGGGSNTTWAKFIRYDKTNPGQAQCGNVHFAPNSDKDYDWSNPKPVTSFCDDWLSYPTLAGAPKQVTCSEWGCNAEKHKVWWLTHLPHIAGTGPDGKRNNWWFYLVN